MSKKNNYFDLPAGLDDAELLEIFHEQNRPLRLDALLRVTGLPRAARKILEDQLYALADEGRLVRLQGGLWAVPTACARCAAATWPCAAARAVS